MRYACPPREGDPLFPDEMSKLWLSPDQGKVEPRSQIAKKVKSVPKLTVLYDNLALSPILLASHGFSCLVEAEEKVLFDTGESGPLLLKNMEILGIDPRDIASIVISHEHYDHIGGLWQVLSWNSRVTVYVLPSFGKEVKQRIQEAGARVFEAGEPSMVTSSVGTTGAVEGEIHEQGLLVKGKRGTLLVGGCCHPGPVAMLHRARAKGEKVTGFLGGLHLAYTPEEEIEKTLRTVKALGISTIAPAHCTGFLATELAQIIWGDGYTPCGVGKVLSW